MQLPHVAADLPCCKQCILADPVRAACGPKAAPSTIQHTMYMPSHQARLPSIGMHVVAAALHCWRTLVAASGLQLQPRHDTPPVVASWHHCTTAPLHQVRGQGHRVGPGTRVPVNDRGCCVFPTTDPHMQHTFSWYMHGGPAAQVAAQAARDDAANAADVVAGLEAEVGGLQGRVQRVETETAAAAQELLAGRQDAAQKVMRW
jgi:hypothetical protein